jgi:hypothetical protein
LTDEGEQAITHFARLSKRYGRLLGAIRPAPKKVGFLIPFEHLVYRIESCYEMSYRFMQLLQAKVDIEPVCAETLTPESIRNYETIVLSQVSWLREGSLKLLSEYIWSGGKVVMDSTVDPQIVIPGAIRLPVAFGGRVPRDYGDRSEIVATASVVASYVKPVASCDDPFVVIRRFEGEGHQFLWVLHTQTGREYQGMNAAYK